MLGIVGCLLLVPLLHDNEVDEKRINATHEFLAMGHGCLTFGNGFESIGNFGCLAEKQLEYSVKWEPVMSNMTTIYHTVDNEMLVTRRKCQ